MFAVEKNSKMENGIYIFFIVALLAVIAGLIWHYRRIIDRKNEFLFRHIVRINELENVIAHSIRHNDANRMDEPVCSPSKKTD